MAFASVLMYNAGVFGSLSYSNIFEIKFTEVIMEGKELLEEIVWPVPTVIDFFKSFKDLRKDPYGEEWELRPWSLNSPLVVGVISIALYIVTMGYSPVATLRPIVDLLPPELVNIILTISDLIIHGIVTIFNLPHQWINILPGLLINILLSLIIYSTGIFIEHVANKNVSLEEFVTQKPILAVLTKCICITLLIQIWS